MNLVTGSKELFEEILSRPLFAHLSTVEKNEPRDSPVWFLWENERIWVLGSYQSNSFIKRIEHEANCAIGIVDYNKETGFVQHVGLRGKAELQSHQEDIIKRLFTKYMGQEKHWDPRFKAVLGDSDWLLICFVPNSVVVRDQSYQLIK
ncbi:pyridoxamine 5'-phosphate oxidase family protein [Alkalihalobacillus sp. NPDC078783]